MDREVFLARVRASTGGPRPETAPDFLSPSPAPDRAALLTQMAERWRRPHAAWHHVPAADAARTVAAILTRGNLRRIALSDHPLLASLRIPEMLPENATILPSPKTLEEVRSGLAAADAGITVAEYGVAETGTLVEWAVPTQPRSLSLLPPVHIALLRAEALLPTLDDLFGALAKTPLTSSLVFISGPSGTADIGLQHVVGVHGPREIHLIMVEGLPTPGEAPTRV